MQALQLSSRLRPDVTLYAVADGHVLRVAGVHHHVHLDAHEAGDLLDALVAGDRPTCPRAAAALDALAAEGLVDPVPTSWTVDGEGVLAAAVRAALLRMGATPDPAGRVLTALDHPLTPSDDAPGGPARACWVDGHRVVVSPPAVPPAHVAARHRAATCHHETDPRAAARPGGRRVSSSAPVLAGAGLELAATQVAAALLQPAPAPYDALVVDLVALTTSRHPVLPLPPPPR